MVGSISRRGALGTDILLLRFWKREPDENLCALKLEELPVLVGCFVYIKLLFF